MPNQRYKLIDVLDESGAKLYIIVDTNFNDYVETYDDKKEADNALNFLNN